MIERIQNFRVQRDHCSQLLIVFVEKLLIFFRLLLAIHFQIFRGGKIDGDIAIDAGAECVVNSLTSKISSAVRAFGKAGPESSTI